MFKNQYPFLIRLSLSGVKNQVLPVHHCTLDSHITTAKYYYRYNTTVSVSIFFLLLTNTRSSFWKTVNRDSSVQSTIDQSTKVRLARSNANSTTYDEQLLKEFFSNPHVLSDHMKKCQTDDLVNTKVFFPLHVLKLFKKIFSRNEINENLQIHDAFYFFRALTWFHNFCSRQIWMSNISEILNIISYKVNENIQGQTDPLELIKRSIPQKQ